MSPRFASITASLLARKGEARPWDAALASEPPKPLVFRPEPVTVTPPPVIVSAKDRSCAVRMSARDYERLGILAVKLKTSRQQLMKQALADLLVDKARQLDCACLGACERGCR